MLALSRGLRRLEAIDDLQAVCIGRATLLEAGADDIVQLDHWAFQIAARDGSPVRLFLRNVDRADSAQCSDVADSLGLSTSTVAAMAMMTGLVDASLPGDLPRLMVIELREFLRGLHKPAVLARELAARVTEKPPMNQAPTLWRDVLAERDE